MHCWRCCKKVLCVDGKNCVIFKHLVNFSILYFIFFLVHPERKISDVSESVQKM